MNSKTWIGTAAAICGVLPVAVSGQSDDVVADIHATGTPVHSPYAGRNHPDQVIVGDTHERIYDVNSPDNVPATIQDRADTPPDLIFAGRLTIACSERS